MLLGKSRTALEILRLSAGLKTKQKLEKKYQYCHNTKITFSIINHAAKNFFIVAIFSHILYIPFN